MKFTTKQHKKVTVISLEGNIMGGPDAAILNNMLHKLVSEDKKQIVVDVKGVKLMNSSGLGMLIAGLSTMRNANGDLKISGASKKIENLFLITKLSNIFEQYKSVNKAVESYSK